MERYCVWSFKPGIKEANVFKYNQTFEAGVELAHRLNNRPRLTDEEISKLWSPEFFQKIKNLPKRRYFCTLQKQSETNKDISVGPFNEDIERLFFGG